MIPLQILQRTVSTRLLYVELWVVIFQLATVPTTLQMNAPGYLGCYEDCEGTYCVPDDRVLSHGPMDSDEQSVEWCFRRCLDSQSMSYKYAGLEIGKECFCGNNEDYNRHGKKDDSECQDRCTGNSDQICGKSRRISMYEISQGVCSNNIGPPTNGSHVITNPRSLSYNLNNFKFFGTRVDFSCDPGYTLHGASSIECIETDYNNITWSDFVPTCIENSSTTISPFTADDGASTDGYKATETNDRRKGQLETGMIVGIAVGIIAALTALLVVVICLRKKRANKRTGISEVVMDTGTRKYANSSYG
ncbi:uncharacterized protein LOC119728088 [Patiria miniata]|uniref:WSC domain-containing protein n=1 Tax=Patiria miniata TaxID=46514 RepID=A0A913ZXQ1_PATMI|nr:uncharacterized protein LOC119728088 [Patiria miniata]